MMQVRAVVRRVDRKTLATEWFPAGNRDAIEALLKLLPPNREDFMVMWEEREVTSGASNALTINTHMERQPRVILDRLQ